MEKLKKLEKLKVSVESEDKRVENNKKDKLIIKRDDFSLGKTVMYKVKLYLGTVDEPEVKKYYFDSYGKVEKFKLILTKVYFIEENAIVIEEVKVNDISEYTGSLPVELEVEL